MSWITKDVIKRQIIKPMKSNEVLDLREHGLSKSTCKILPMLKSIDFGKVYSSIKSIDVLTEWLDEYRVKIYLKTKHRDNINIFNQGYTSILNGKTNILSINLNDITDKDSSNFILNSVTLGNISDIGFTYNTPNGIYSMDRNSIIKINGIEVVNFGYVNVQHSGNESFWVYKSGKNTYNLNRNVVNNINITIDYGSMRAYDPYGSSVNTYRVPWGDWKMNILYLDLSFETINTYSIFNVVIWEV